MVATWPSERAERYLLRTDVARPLSTDSTVWESVPDEVGSVEPEWHGVLGLWSKASDLLQLVHGGALELDWKEWWLIAIGLRLDVLAAADREKWSSPGKMALTSPNEPAPEWQLLGYDVSDEWLLSGLTNCGYSEAEIPDLRREWTPRLNDHHLFPQLEHAIAFKTLSDTRVPEHAPSIYPLPHSCSIAPHRHASLSTTQVYTHLSLRHLRETYGKCDPRERQAATTDGE